MAEVVELQDLQSGYVELVRHVRDTGRVAAPRGLKVRELRNVTVTVAEPLLGVPVGVGRRLNMAIGAAETASLIGGISSAALMIDVAHTFGNFTNGDRLLGAYGPRLFSMLPDVVRKLSEDSESRQAIAVVWRENEHRISENKDVPCTVSLSWSVRDGKLDATTHMRSNDVWLGVPYDFWMFTRLQMTLAWALKLELGTYTHVVDNLHVYDKDVSKTHNLYVPVNFDRLEEKLPPAPIPDVPDPWAAVNRWAWAVGESANVVNGLAVANATPQVLFYENLLSKHADGVTKRMCGGCRYVVPLRDFGVNGVDEVCGECRNKLG